MPTRARDPSTLTHSCSFVYRRSSGTFISTSSRMRPTAGREATAARHDSRRSSSRRRDRPTRVLGIDRGRDVVLDDADREADPADRGRGRSERQTERSPRDGGHRHHQRERRDLADPPDLDPHAPPREQEDTDPEDRYVPSDDRDGRPYREHAADREGDDSGGDRKPVRDRI